MFKKLKKLASTGALALLMFMIMDLSAIPVKNSGMVEAASAQDILIHGAAAMLRADVELNSLDKNWQYFYYSRAQETGLVGPKEDPIAFGRFERMVNQIEKANGFKFEHRLYLSPQTNINGGAGLAHVIHVTRGIYDHMTDDQAAFILAHEYGHSESNHFKNGIKAKLGMGVLVDLYLTKNNNYISSQLANVTKNMVSAEVIDQGKEREADSLAFDFAIKAGYNPGGGAAAFFKMRELYGEGYSYSISDRMKGSNTHPPFSERIEQQMKMLTEFSGNRVSVVKDRYIMVDKTLIVSPVAIEKMMTGERVCLIAGNLARAFNQKLTAPAENRAGEIYIGNQKIMTVFDGDGDPDEIINKLNHVRGIITE